MKWSGIVEAQDFVEGVLAIHLSSYVESPFKDRGGLMLVAPPGQLKTRFLDILDENFESVRSISNSYMQTMIRMQPAFYSGYIRSLCFPDLQSIYAGDPRTASRIENMMMQLAAEATRTIGGQQDSRFAKFKSRCTIFAAMQETFRAQHETKWDDSGFHRRFLWATYTLKDPDVLTRAIHHWTLADIGNFRIPKVPGNLIIKNVLAQSHLEEITAWVRHQPEPHEIQRQILCKAVSALHWHYKTSNIKKNALFTMKQFAECLQEDAALIQLPDQDFDKEKPIKKVTLGQPANKTNGISQQQQATK